MTNLNELNNSPVWLKNLSKETQYEMYLMIKQSLPTLRNIFSKDQIISIETAMADYEKLNNIV